MNDHQRIIGLTGPAGAGKDTVAAGLTCMHGFHRIAFADPIRRGLQVMLGLDAMSFEHPHKEIVIGAIGKSPRQMMQTLGTEWGRSLVHPELWLLIARTNIEQSLASGRRVVISDVRFDNEANMLRDMGGQIWHITRNQPSRASAHISESGVTPTDDDRFISNDSSIDSLYRKFELPAGVKA